MSRCCVGDIITGEAAFASRISISVLKSVYRAFTEIKALLNPVLIQGLMKFHSQ